MFELFKKSFGITLGIASALFTIGMTSRWTESLVPTDKKDSTESKNTEEE